MGGDDTWALFGSDDDAATDSAAGVASKRPRSASSGDFVSVSGPAVGENDASRFGAPKASLYDDACFASARALWRHAESETPALNTFLDALIADAVTRAPTVATALRKHKPEGGAAADALLDTVRAAVELDWGAVGTFAEQTTDAHARQLNSGNWPDECWQLSHVLALGFRIAAACVVAVGITKNTKNENSTNSTTVADSLGSVALEALAMVSLVSDPAGVPHWLGSAILVAERKCVAESRQKKGGGFLSRNEKATRAANRRNNEVTEIPTQVPSDAPRIDQARSVVSIAADDTSTAMFHETYFKQNAPVVLTRLVCEKRGWSCLDEWRDVSVFFKSANDRLVPVTFGGHGDEFPSVVTEMALGDFITEYVLRSEDGEDGQKPKNTEREAATDTEEQATATTTDKPKTATDGKEIKTKTAPTRVAYMSQHCLFHQVPCLAKTVSVPKYALGKLKPATGAVNLWVGTGGTKTALHRDPYSNLLVQTCGFKYVRLYASSETKNLYPETPTRGGNANTFTKSAVAVERPDLTEHPLFANAQFSETILKPGDGLFIPHGMWHYVRALTPSVSVNFWWN